MLFNLDQDEEDHCPEDEEIVFLRMILTETYPLESPLVYVPDYAGN